MLKDTVLLWRFKCGSKEAFCRIYEKYVDDLLTLAANLLDDPGSAEDVVQDVFVKFVESAKKFRLTGSLKAYLATCVANRARDYIRRNRRQQKVAANAADRMIPEAISPVQLVMHNEQLHRLSQAMMQLPYEQREAVVLRLHGDLRFRQIAQLQDVNVKTALTRYRYGLDKLRSILNGEVER
jgi:RNA polymerase sigma-70 factor (ECF subfamily)